MSFVDNIINDLQQELNIDNHELIDKETKIKEINIDTNFSKNGLITKIWGYHLWEALHSITFGYPENPSSEQKIIYRRFFTDLGEVLPCKYCRDSYKKFIQCGNTELHDSIFDSRNTLTKWLYDLHEAVNAKLGVTYKITYDDVVQKYESYRARCITNSNGCVIPLDLKSQSYMHAFDRRAVIISSNIARCFIQYAKKRGIDIEARLEQMEKLSLNTPEWRLRDKICWKIIKKSRLDGLNSLEKDGEYKDLPTIHELKLISYHCSLLSDEDLVKIVRKLGYDVYIEYKLNS